MLGVQGLCPSGVQEQRGFGKLKAYRCISRPSKFLHFLADIVEIQHPDVTHTVTAGALEVLPLPVRIFARPNSNNSKA